MAKRLVGYEHAARRLAELEASGRYAGTWAILAAADEGDPLKVTKIGAIELTRQVIVEEDTDA